MKTAAKFLAALDVSAGVAGPANSQMRRNTRIVGSSNVYPFSKAVSEQLARANPGIRAYPAELAREATFGPQGYLAKLGLIVLPDAVRKRYQGLATILTPMSGAGLK